MNSIDDCQAPSLSELEFDLNLGNVVCSKLSSTLDNSIYGPALLNGICTMDGRQRMLLARDGTFLIGCSAVAKTLETNDCLYLKRGVVCVALPEYRDRVQALLRVQTSQVRDLALPYLKGDGHLLIRATAISDDVVCLSLQDAKTTTEPELPDLEEIFQLTRTEAMIVEDLFGGRAPQQIADDHNNSVHTIRAHIRHCYDKLGITCREELWRMLNAYRLS